MNGRARWIPHNVNPADGLAELKGAHLRPLFDLLNDVSYHLIIEEAQLKQRKEEKETLGQARRLKDSGKPTVATYVSVINPIVFLSVGYRILADESSTSPQTSSNRAGVVSLVPFPFQEIARTQESGVTPMGKRPRNKRVSSPPPAPSVDGDSSVSDGGTRRRRRYAPPVEVECQGHTMEPTGPGRSVMSKEAREPEGYTLGHAYNRIVFSQFANLDFKPDWCKGCGWTWGPGVPPPAAYVFSRDSCDGKQEDDLRFT